MVVVDLHRFFHINFNVPNKCRKHRNDSCLSCKKLLGIHAKIDSLNSALENLLDEAQKLKSELNDDHDPFTNRLPVEISSSIMALSLPVSPSLHVFRERFNFRYLALSVFGLGCVSRNWRQIAHSEAQLWAILSINISSSTTQRNVSWMEAWIKRLRGHSLYLQIVIQKIPPCFERILSWAVPPAQRLKVLALDMEHSMVPFVSNALSIGQLSRLEHLDLRIPPHTQQPEISTLRASPSICTTDSTSLDSVTFDCSRLTELTVQSEISINQFRKVLQNAPKLTRCRLENVYGAEDPEHLTHSSLEHLSILYYFSPESWDLFTFPSLRTLRIHRADHIFMPYVWPCFTSFLRRSRISIRDFTIVQLKRASEDSEIDKMVEILTLLPHLERLSLDGHILRESRFFRSLNEIATSSNPEFLSRITRFVFENTYIYSTSQLSCLMDLVKTITPRLEHTPLHIELNAHKLAGRPQKNMIVDSTDKDRSFLDTMQALNVRITSRHERILDLTQLIWRDD